MRNLSGGEHDFWENIQKTIREKAAKYILVLSHNTFSKAGVKDEWEYARSIAQEFKIEDFIIPARIDNVSYNERIGLNRINVIDFSDTWRDGFLKLIKKLNNDNILKTDTQNSIYQLLESAVNIYNSVNSNSEKYYTNLLPINNLPEYLYVFKFHSDTAAKAIRNECSGYPICLNGNLLFCFEENIPSVLTKKENIKIRPQKKLKIKVSDILVGVKITKDFEIGNPLNSLKALLRNAYRDFSYSKLLLKYEMSNKGFCYYYKTGTIENNKVSYIYQGKKKTKNLIGNYSKRVLVPSLGEYETIEYYWHFGITSRVLTDPFLCYSLKTHILFSDDGENIWESDSKLHSARRDKCRMWHNAEWREIFLAFIHSLGKPDGFIEIPLSKTARLQIPSQPVIFNSSVGYVEPADFERMFLLRNEREEEVESTAESEEENDEAE